MAGSRIAKVEIDHDLCVGSSMCLGVHPQGFRLGGTNQAVYVGEAIDQDLAEEAAELCPVSAIKLTYEDKQDG